MSQAASVKDEIKKLIDELPEDCTWSDAMYRIHVRQAIEAGLEDVVAGRTVSHEDARREFGLDP